MSFDAIGRPPVAVIVPSRDRPEKLDRCLGSLRGALRDGDELVVVDSASIAADAVAAAAQRHGARLVRCELPGVDRARNAGWRTVQHDIVLFTDDDVTVDPAWADAFVECFATHPEAAFVTGWIGAMGEPDARFTVALKTDEQPVVLDSTTRGVLGHSASLAVRRDVLEKIRGFDESMGAGSRFRASPEVDLFDRIFAIGRTGRFEPSARAWHESWRGTGEVIRLHYGYGVGAGARMAKLLRTDRQRLRVVAAENLWSWGVVTLWEHVWRLRWRATVVDLNRIRGFVVGFTRGIRASVVDGHFV
ncbi:MAG: glycosyltransferase [Frankiales bacterium]|nr:glycosyltransferase [Frankiales bacterium]